MSDEESSLPPTKKSKLSELTEDDLKPVNSFLQIDTLQERLLELQEIRDMKIQQIEQKYRELSAPIYEERRKIISKIPHFWQNALQGHPNLREIFKKIDRQILSHLIDLHIIENVDKTSSWYRITFTFEENEWITETTLWKQFTKQDGNVVVTSSGIHFKPEKAAQLSSEVTFLHWFLPSDQDTELGSIIKDEVWSNPAFFGAISESIIDDNDDANSSNINEEEDGIDPETALAIAAAWSSEEE